MAVYAPASASGRLSRNPLADVYSCRLVLCLFQHIRAIYRHVWSRVRSTHYTITSLRRWGAASWTSSGCWHLCSKGSSGRSVHSIDNLVGQGIQETGLLCTAEERGVEDISEADASHELIRPRGENMLHGFFESSNTGHGQSSLH